MEGKEEWCDEIEETLPQMSDTNTTMMNVTSEMETKLSLQEEAEQKEECNSTKNTKIENPSYKYDDDPIEDDEQIPGIKFVNYHDESQLESVMKLVGKDLSEPYSVFTYRYFLHRFPELCIFAVPTTDAKESNNSENEGKEEADTDMEPIGCVVCKIDEEDPPQKSSSGTSTKHNNPSPILCGYMAMLAVDTSYRRSGIGTALVKRVVRRMRKMGCTSVTLETEVSNKAAMRLYEERLGFVREEFLARYYLNWGDAYRLKLHFS